MILCKTLCKGVEHDINIILTTFAFSLTHLTNFYKMENFLIRKVSTNYTIKSNPY